MLKINATTRKEQGKSASRRLRHNNSFPAIIYGGSEAAIAIELDHDEIVNLQSKDGFYTDVIELVLDGKAMKVKVQAMQRHHFKPKVLHMDFVRA